MRWDDGTCLSVEIKQHLEDLLLELRPWNYIGLTFPHPKTVFTPFPWVIDCHKLHFNNKYSLLCIRYLATNLFLKTSILVYIQQSAPFQDSYWLSKGGSRVIRRQRSPNRAIFNNHMKARLYTHACSLFEHSINESLRVTFPIDSASITHLFSQRSSNRWGSYGNQPLGIIPHPFGMHDTSQINSLKKLYFKRLGCFYTTTPNALVNP